MKKKLYSPLLPAAAGGGSRLFNSHISPTGYDPLTNLASIREFQFLAPNSVDEIYSLGKIPAVIFFDLAGMKAFNLRYGFDEGDNLLVCFANILVAKFGKGNCCRFGSDQFAVISSTEKIEECLHSIFSALANTNSGKTLNARAGIYAISHVDENIIYAIDKAKMAADINKSSIESRYTWFNEKMSSDYLLKEYIVSHLDQAIERGWIRVYLQPVIRTLTRRICSFEALARWDDPTYGFLQPGQFISVLENNGLSFKLDMAVARRTAQIMRTMLDEGKNVVPVSLNFSRHDFTLGDPVSSLESLLKEFALPSDYFVVEITESAVIKDYALMRGMIERFHEIGIDVWMDDYGSGYSSLNVLKDFNFNEIKIDMEFLSNLNKRSQIIITQTIQMAKKLGIHTLAEGVETEEQIEFLTKIGCEKLQGYYFGSPMSFADIYPYIEKKGLLCESREASSFFEQAGLVEIPDDTPTALFLYGKDKTFLLLRENDAYRDIIMSDKISDADAIRINMNSSDSVLSRKFRNLAKRAIVNGGEEKMVFVDRGNYYLFSFEQVVRNRNYSLLLAHIDVVNYDFGIKQNQLLDNTLRNIISIFDSIYLVDMNTDSRTVIFSDIPSERSGDVLYGLKKFYSNYPVRHIYPDDLDRCRQFMTKDFLIENINKYNRGFYEDSFRIKKADGNYEWKDFIIITVPETDNKKMFVCIKASSMDYQSDIVSTVNRYFGFDENKTSNSAIAKDALLWRTMMEQSHVKFFWKDSQRRFAGVSKSFLDYYNLKSFDEIKGKTDEEVGWHANNAPYRQDELNVLKKGKIIRNSDGECVVDGVLRPISATKFPIYKKGKIIGLMGYFIDLSDKENTEESSQNSRFVDPVTGFMNSRGILLALFGMENELRDHNRDYTVILCDVGAITLLRREFGLAFSEKVLKKIAEKIKSVFTPMTSLGRLQSGRFIICYRDNNDSLTKILQKLKDEISKIRQVDSHKCSLSAALGIAKGSESSNAQKVLELASKRMRSSQDRVSLKNIATGDIYSDLPLPYALVHPIIEDEKVTDLQYMFVNSKYCEISGKTVDEVVGHTYREVFPNSDVQWLQFTRRSCLGEVCSGRIFADVIHHWVQFYCTPSSKPGCCSIMFTIVDEDKKSFDRLTRSKTTDDCIIRIARTLNSENNINVSISEAFNYLGTIIHPDRLFIFDIDGWQVSRTHDWCRKGIETLSGYPSKFDYRVISYWEKILFNESSVVVHDTEVVSEFSPKLYEFLKKLNITNFIATPLYNNGKLKGYLVAENYRADELVDTRRLLETVSFFIADRKALSVSLDKLKRLSSHDALTGAGSRNALFEKISELKKVSSMLGIVFADLNGLKLINDNHGHAAGDEAICGAANLLFRFCGETNVYRNGGDEFIAIIPNISLGSFEKVRDNLVEASQIDNASSLAVGFEWCEDSRKIEESMKKADKKMYDAKAEYYRNHDRRHRE
ncbi:PAS domain S-box-containing protein/diguanylate cyclase (GGDEF) domain-containing protein [Succinivibrio dextrinosolvens]|uniref:EAL domain-containing protein n=1 Tax=Succinivibrio dextrinosolvens TaxID=83771 RepID=UPI0008E4BF63|nr:EAL domain-containing protein [Succinivibrio dextrinosolvens]SFS44491.1 PAS domain S-box-containing protein/diguanylate cyclase (GGDEF) domain-containing protein [Succinivibrio dextrinosolvens]